MTEKLWKIIGEEFISYTGGAAQLISNGECKVHLWETPKDAQLFCDKLNVINEENEQLKKQLSEQGTQIDFLKDENHHMRTVLEENKQLKSENKRLTDKLNELALEFLNYDMVTMGKATEISEMCYYDFLKFRKENGNPMELKK